jgi:hypothetical protein
MNSPDHSTKGTPSPRSQRRIAGSRRALTACKCRVSGSISFPLRGAFHLSLTVLVRYRWPKVVRLGGWSPQLPTGFRVSRGTQEQAVHQPLRIHRVQDSHLLWCGFPDHFPSPRSRLAAASPATACPTTPAGALTRPGLVWADPGSLATTTGLSVDSSSSRY